LALSIVEGSEEMFQALLEAGADVDSRSNRGSTPLHIAAQEHQVAMARALIQSGATVDAVDSYGRTPLHIAVLSSKGRCEMIHLLLDSSADPDLPNPSGVTPLKLAEKIGNYDVKGCFTRRHH
jgi:ankyrin repeat protein